MMSFGIINWEIVLEDMTPGNSSYSFKRIVWNLLLISHNTKDKGIASTVKKTKWQLIHL